MQNPGNWTGFKKRILPGASEQQIKTGNNHLIHCLTGSLQYIMIAACVVGVSIGGRCCEGLIKL